MWFSTGSHRVLKSSHVVLNRFSLSSQKFSCGSQPVLIGFSKVLMWFSTGSHRVLKSSHVVLNRFSLSSQKFSCGSQPVLIEFSKVLFSFGDVFRARCLSVPVPWLAQVRFRAVVNVFVNTFMASLCVYKTVYTGCELFSYSLQKCLQQRMGVPMCLQKCLHSAVGCLSIDSCAFPAAGEAGLFCCMILARFAMIGFCFRAVSAEAVLAGVAFFGQKRAGMRINVYWQRLNLWRFRPLKFRVF